MYCALQMLRGCLRSGCVMSRGSPWAICSGWPAQLKVSRGLLQQAVQDRVMAVACSNHSPEGARSLSSIRACGAQPFPAQVLTSAAGRRRLLDLQRMSSPGSPRWLAPRPRNSRCRLVNIGSLLLEVEKLPSFFRKLFQVTSKHARPFRRESRRTPERPRKTLRSGMAEQLQQDETFLTGLRHSPAATGEGIQKT
jgi:hypothetical protein